MWILATEGELHADSPVGYAFLFGPLVLQSTDKRYLELSVSGQKMRLNARKLQPKTLPVDTTLEADREKQD